VISFLQHLALSIPQYANHLMIMKTMLSFCISVIKTIYVDLNMEKQNEYGDCLKLDFRRNVYNF